jgi:amino acid adenylation domain-containing protein
MIETATPTESIPPEAEAPAALPLSSGQQRLWFLHRMDPLSPAYNMAGAYRLSGALGLGALAEALGEIVRRHEVLRTVYALWGEEPVQVVQPPVPLALPVVDLSALPSEAREAEAERVAAVEAGRPFALDFPLDTALEGALDPRLAPAPVLRASVVRLAGREHLVLVTVHHIACDGWSIGVLLRELGGLYAAFTAGRTSPLPELPIQYVDFAVWQREQIAGEALAGQLAYWRQRLAGAPPALDLPADRPRPPVQGLGGGEVPVRLPPALADSLARLGRQEGATFFMVLIAAFQTLLHREAGVDDVSVGTPVSGRGQSETEGLIGFFVNTLVLRTDLGGRPSFRAAVARVREASVEAYAHQDLPFERLVEELVPQRDPARTPLFQAFFSLQEWTPDPGALPGLEMTTLRIPADTAKFDLSLAMVAGSAGSAGSAGLSGVFEYSTDLFDRTTIQRLALRFERLVRAVAADPERSVDALPLLGEAERHQVAVEWAADTRRDYPRERCLHELFEEQARRTPDLLALSGWTEERPTSLTYSELDAWADGLARRLQDRGVGPEALVAVLLERSPALVVALLAILKAGGAYVPLDPAYPVERLDFLLRDSGARTLVTASADALPAGLEIGPDVRIVEIAGGEEEDGPSGPPERFGVPDRLAYVVYTSGSTGRPKGVAMPHRGVARLALGTVAYAPLGPGDRMAQAANASFDAAAFEIWSALLNGAELVVLPAHRMSLEELGDHLERERITVFCPTASLFNQMVDGPLARLAGVRRILTGGEVVSPVHVRKLLTAFPDSPRVVCCYGPTENTTFTSTHPVESGDGVRSPLPIGRPIANTRVYLLDGEHRPVPLGLAGELCAGGDGLARGYLGRPELTAERFVPDPFGGSGDPGARLYRTGDRARWRPDGTLDFLGRLDGQTKLRGFRVEPGEIEAALTAHPAVEQAAVLPREDGPAGPRLVAFLVPAPGSAQDVAEVQAFLRGRLPEHLVPAALVWLDALPLTEHGKVDRRALARVEARTEPAARGVEPAAGPRDPIEEGLAGIWRDVLGTVEDAGPEDDFFELGGHSLLATQVASRVREAFGVELPLRDLFAAPRLADLAARIGEERGRHEGRLPAVPPISLVSPEERAAGLPLTFGQEWMWIADQLDPEAAVHNAPISVRLRGALDLAALEAALGQIVRRHETLHLRFVVKDGVPRLVPSPEIPLPFQAIDVSALPEGRREPEARRAASAEGARPFDLAAELPVRALAVRLGPEEHILLLGLHHLVIDGWSFGLLLREIPVFYVAARTGTPPGLPALPFQYGDYAVWQRGWLTGEALEAVLAWWREHLSPPRPLWSCRRTGPGPPRGWRSASASSSGSTPGGRRPCAPSPAAAARLCSRSCSPPSRRCSPAFRDRTISWSPRRSPTAPAATWKG